MKKKLLAGFLAGAMILSITACGGSKEADTPTTAAETKAATTEAATTEAATTEAATTEAAVSVGSTATKMAETSDDFSLLDVTADLVDAAIYAVDDDETEYVITLFRDPEGNSYISLMNVDADGTGDVLCGAYDDSNVSNYTDDKNIDWTQISTIDVYTGTEFTAVFVEADDGSVAVANEDFSVVMDGEYLTADQAIDYMGAAATFID